MREAPTIIFNYPFRFKSCNQTAGTNLKLYTILLLCTECIIVIIALSAAFTLTASAALDKNYHAPSNRRVTNYATVLRACSSDTSAKRLFALRKFFLDGTEHYLIVDIDTLRTEILSAENVMLAGGTHASNLDDSRKIASPYYRAIAFCAMKPYRLHNHGIRGFSRNTDGAVLSADLCPSKYPLDRTPFHLSLSAFSVKHRPLPIAIAVSGKWLESHASDIKWLTALQEKKLFNITWINHSFSHPREFKQNPRLLSKGFLLAKGIDVTSEILTTEIAMIEAGLTPSVFFRFPGLVADEKLVKKVCDLGLIPVGSNAWLAKREQARGGSIILIHANRHEPKGIVFFQRLLAKKKTNIKRGKWKLLDIRDCLVSEFTLYAQKE